MPATTSAAMRIADNQHQRSLPRTVSFTRTVLDRLAVPPGKDRAWVHDAKTSNLCFMKTASGGSAYYWYGKVSGRPIRYRLGDGTLAVEVARKLALEVAGKVAKGVNPQAEKQQARGSMTFGELFAWFMESHAKKLKRTWRKDQLRYNMHLAHLANRKANSITRRDIGALHAKIGATAPGSANRVLSLLSSVYNRARATGLELDNPATGVRHYPEHQRERFLQPAEMQRFLEALEAEPSQLWKDFFQVCLFTGARRENCLSMRWDELDLDGGAWRIPGKKFKTGQPQTIHLPAVAVEILKRRVDNRSPFVFPGTGKSGHICEPKKAWRTILERAGLKDLWIHDLRRSLGSWMAATGANLSTIGKSLGHQQVSTTQRYARLNLDSVKAGVDLAVAAMLATAKPAGNPVAMAGDDAEGVDSVGGA
jgi:integrase